MIRPTRATSSGRAYLDLQARARREGRNTDELLQLFVLERFLYRVSQSAYGDRLVLKGGMLLAVFDQRRPTADVDLLARQIENDTEMVVAMVREILAIAVDDGVSFPAGDLRASSIREGHLYAGVRVVAPATVSRARLSLRLDVNVGDPVTPRPQIIQFPSLLDAAFPLLAYPLEMVLAEKIVTMIERGVTNTRERDFADVVLLTGHHVVDAGSLRAAMVATADHRGQQLAPIGEALRPLGERRQRDWEGFLRGSGLAEVLPDAYAAAIELVAAFADRVIEWPFSVRVWDPAKREWDR